MDNLKVRVKNEAESKEVQELFFELGGSWTGEYGELNYLSRPFLYLTRELITFGSSVDAFNDHENKEITIQQLRDLVVLKRNYVGDATHIALDNCAKYFLSSNSEWYCFSGEGWYKIKEPCLGAKPIDKEVKMKEYLDPDNGYALITADDEVKGNSNWIEVPEGADTATKCGEYLIFWKDNIYSFSEKDGDTCFVVAGEDDYSLDEYLETYDDICILWQRSETEKVQGEKDNVNNPSHYSDSAIECIDAMEAMLTPNQFIGYLRGNMFKYQWRYQKKNGVEDLKKSQWYLNKLIEKENGNP